MLSSLHIENYVLIDSLDIKFPEGLVIITGQTGAGKSILLGALSLLLGSKADASCISEGKDSCIVEAVFEPGERIVRRVVSRSGRSRCFVDDCPVQAAEMSELVSSLIDIHSQHKSLLLTDSRFQLLVLDKFAGNESLLESASALYRQVTSLSSQLKDLKDAAGRSTAELDYAKAQYRQLETARLREGELEELEEEQKKLANAEEIKTSLSRIENLFEPSDEGGVIADVKEAARLLARLNAFLPSAASLGERLESVRIELADILSDVESDNAGISLSQERLEAVEQRLGDIYSLLKKHSCKTVGELVAVRDSFAAQIGDCESSDERIEALEAELDARRKEFSAVCAALRESRSKSAPEFARSIVSTLRFLELDKADFRVELKTVEASSSGEDAACFLFSAGGTAPADISKAASGGELSRIMLSLKALMARFTGMPTMIFDEIDTGVSGSVADKMGQIICEMGKTMQVMAITHLPQVAAKGRAHFLVSKSLDGSQAVSRIVPLDADGRINEIARLLSGASITPEAIANAKSLLNGN